MRHFLGLILPIAIILAPLAILILFGGKRNKISRKGFGLVILVCFLARLVVPILATLLSVHGLGYNLGPDDLKCFTGAGIFLFLGFLVNLIAVPIAGIVLFKSRRLTNKVE